MKKFKWMKNVNSFINALVIYYFWLDSVKIVKSFILFNLISETNKTWDIFNAKSKKKKLSRNIGILKAIAFSVIVPILVGRFLAFPEITVFLRVSRAVADAQSAGIDFVADDRTNALVHDTSITSRRVFAVCSIALFCDTCLVSGNPVFVSLTLQRNASLNADCNREPRVSAILENRAP